MSLVLVFRNLQPTNSRARTLYRIVSTDGKEVKKTTSTTASRDRSRSGSGSGRGSSKGRGSIGSARNSGGSPKSRLKAHLLLEEGGGDVIGAGGGLNNAIGRNYNSKGRRNSGNSVARISRGSDDGESRGRKKGPGYHSDRYSNSSKHKGKSTRNKAHHIDNGDGEDHLKGP